MKFHVRAFVPNPGHAYDPAPLHEFDEAEPVSISDIASPGDILIESNKGEAYRVVERFFEYGTQSGRCALMVEQTQVVSPF